MSFYSYNADDENELPAVTDVNEETKTIDEKPCKRRGVG